MPKYLSGRVKRTPQGSLTTDRYQYLGLEQAEPNLGDPPELDAIPSGTQYQIVSLIDRPGERFWVPIGGGIQPGSVTIRDEGSVVPRTDANPNLGVSSITDVNFVGAAVTVVGFLNPDGSPGTAVTVTISPPGDNFEILFNNVDGEFGTSPNFVFDNTTGIGSVGIGTSTPTQNLHVVGNVKLDNTIYGEDNQPGNTGNLLVKTATGGVKWTSSGSVTSGAGGTITQIQFHDDTGLVGGASNFVFDSTNSRIGIGSTQPDRLLDVLGDSRFTGVTTFSGELDVDGHAELDNLNVTGVSTFNDNVGIGTITAIARLDVYKGTNATDIDIFAARSKFGAFNIQCSDTNAANPEWRLRTYANEDLVFSPGGTGSSAEKVRIKATGNVGIGTNNPNHELTVYGDEPNFRLTHTGSTNKFNALYTQVDGTGVEWNSYQDGTGTRRPFIFKQYTTEVFRIDSSGNVGIGTTNPTASNIESALESNTKVLAVGILTANQIFGKVTSIQETLGLDILNVTGVTSTKNLLVTGIATFEQSVSIGGTLTYEDVTNVDSIGIITAGKGFRATSGGLSVSGVSTFIGANGAQQVKIQSQGGGASIFLANYQGVDVGDASARLGVGENDNALIFTNASASQVGVFAIGNTDAVPLVFSTANTERLRIASDGKIGIGTTNPSQKLEVYDGRILVRNITDDAAKIVLRDDSGSYNHYQIRNQDGNFKIRNSGADPQYDAMTIESGGNLGIGTNDPGTKLDVREGSILVDAFNTSGDHGLFFRRGFTDADSNSYNLSILAYDHSGANKDGLSINAFDGISFCTGSNTRSEKVRIDSSGRMGVGTTNPLQKLDVRGVLAISATTDTTVRTTITSGATGLFVNHGDNSDTIFQNQGVERVRFEDTGEVGIGTNDPDGKLHVFKGSAGNVTADSDANDIVIESDTDTGVSFLSPNDEQARIKFADPDDTDVGAITYDHTIDTLSLTAGGTNVIGITSTKTTIEGDLDVNGAITYSTVADVNSVGVITAQNGINVTGAGVSVVGVSTFFDDVDFNSGIGIGKSIFHIGDEGTRIHFPTEEEVAIETAGSERLRITSTGVIQLSNLYSSYTSGTATRFSLYNDTNNHYGLHVGGNYDLNYNAGGSTSGGKGEHRFHTAATERLRIASDGKIGIGTDDPTAQLQVYRKTQFGGNPLIQARSNNGSTNELKFQIDGDGDATFNGNVGIGTSGKLTIQPNPNPTFGVSEAIRIDQNNATDDRALQIFEFENSLARHHALTHNLRVYRYSASAYGYTQGKYSGSQMHEYAGGTYKIFTNSQVSVGNAQDIVPTERFRLTSSGDVGIGTFNPTGSSAVVGNNATLAVGILTARQVFGSFQGGIIPDGDLVVNGNFKVTGISTFVGVTTFGNVGIGGSLPDDFVTNKFVVGDGGGSRGMTIYSDGTLGQIYFADGNTGDNRKRGGIVYDHSQNELKFSVNAVEKLVIDSDGDVGIGTDDPTSKFDVHMSDKSGVNFLNVGNNSAIDLKSNQVESCGRIQVSESVNGGVMILSTKNTSGDITERLRMHTNGDVTTTGADFSIANAGFTARKDDCVSITRASGTPLEINRTGNDGELIKFYQDGTEEANISINGDDLIFGNTTEKFRINSSGAKVTGNLEVTGELTYEDVTNIDAVGIITAQNGIQVLGAGITVTGISTFYDNVNFQDRVLIGREVGTAIHGVVGHTDNQLQVVGTGTSCGISIIRYSNDDDAASLTFAKSKSSTIGTNIAVQNGDELGVILFNGADQSGGDGDIANSGARIRAQVTGHVTHDDEHDIPTSLFFDTSPDGLASPKERMSIRHDGLVGMGTTNAVGTQSQYSRLIVSGNNNSTSGYGVLTIQAQSSVLHESTIGTLVFADRRGDFANITAFTDATTGGSDFPGSLKFATTPDGATVPTNKLTILSGGNVGIGSEIPQYKLEVVGTVAATNFDSLSDRKVKTNIQIIQDPIDKIKKIDGVSFNWKSDNKPSLGVIADNVQSILPEIVSGNDPKSVNYNGLIGLLIEVVKDQQKQIEELRGLIDK